MAEGTSAEEEVGTSAEEEVDGEGKEKIMFVLNRWGGGGLEIVEPYITLAHYT